MKLKSHWWWDLTARDFAGLTGAVVSNSHTSNIRSVGKKEIGEHDIAFRLSVDPYGLLNPGRFEADSRADERFRLELPTDSWDRRLA
jgi:hypothetical protein